jgi:hypothetical protein
MKEMNELTELYQRGDEVEESSIDTTTNNVHPKLHYISFNLFSTDWAEPYCVC